jgi:type II secretory pathway pseudopilin PulG
MSNIPTIGMMAMDSMMMTIVIMGILLSIATSSWFGLVDSRRVTSDTNQFASDLRLAHTKSTNQLKDYAVVTPGTYGLTGSADYYIVPLLPGGLLPDLPNVRERSLDDSGRTEIDTAFGVKFEPDGSATNVAGLTTTISLDDGGAANDPMHTVDLNPATSRVKID